ncbi:MAG TPA: hypothetical protein VF103_05330 [Polyangiaceae bacterium]
MRRVVAVGLVGAALASACGGESERVDEDGDHKGGSAGASKGGSSGSTSTGGASGTSGGGSAGTPDDWRETCDRAPELICAKLDECAPLFAALLFPPDCRALYSQICADFANLPDTSLTPAIVLDCFAALAEMSCDDWLYNGELPAGCRFTGSRTIGSPCGNDAQCTTGRCSATFDACGTCEPLAEEGEDCSVAQCREGLRCNADLVCAPPKRLGDACRPDSSCESTMVCEAMVCEKPPGVGEPCGMGALGCDLFQGAFCDFDSMVCEELEVSGEGEPCAGICVAGTFCDTSVTTPVCVRARAEGETCTTTGELECDSLLSCTGGVCTRLDPATCN